MRPLRIAIDARRLSHGMAGGVEQVMIGLAHGLSSLDGDEDYLFLTSPSDPDWIQPYLSGRCRVLPAAGALTPPAWRTRLANVAPLRAAWEVVSPLVGPTTIPIPESDGTIERAGIDVMHFTQQNAFLTRVPSIYQPHDLQHLHLPQFFTRRARLAREVSYRAFCSQTRAVVMMTHWGRRDIIDRYTLPNDLVCVVPGASVLSAYPAPSAADAARLRRQHGLPDTFALFPAQTFPHKNHLTLLDALAVVRDRYGIRVPLVATGHQSEFFQEITKRIDLLALRDQIHFVGFVPPDELRALYRSARLLAFPSAFEGWGLPVVEAFAEGVPVACADATSLPEVVDRAALLFPTYDASAMADAIVRVWTDERLRDELVAKGRARVAALTWERTARIFRAHYRRIAGVAPTHDDDIALVEQSFGRPSRVV